MEGLILSSQDRYLETGWLHSILKGTVIITNQNNSYFKYESIFSVYSVSRKNTTRLYIMLHASIYPHGLLQTRRYNNGLINQVGSHSDSWSERMVEEDIECTTKEQLKDILHCCSILPQDAMSHCINDQNMMHDAVSPEYTGL